MNNDDNINIIVMIQENSGFTLYQNEKLDNLLLPIFNTVRKNKINSYFQFKKLPSVSDENIQQNTQNSHTIVSKTTSNTKRRQHSSVANYIFSNNRSTGTAMTANKDYSNKKRSYLQPQKINKIMSTDKDEMKQKNVKQMTKTFYQQRNKNSLSKLAEPSQINNLAINTALGFRMNATAYTVNLGKTPHKTNGISPPKTTIYDKSKTKSKMKKHLVEEIDFEEIEKLLYKKRDWISRYQYFCQKIKNNMRKNQQKQLISRELQANNFEKMHNKEILQNQRNPQSQCQIKMDVKNQKNSHNKGKSKNCCRQLTPDVIKNIATISTIRSTPRKKFWIRQASLTQKNGRRSIQNKNIEDLLSHNLQQNRQKSLSGVVQGRPFQTISYSPNLKPKKHISEYKNRQKSIQKYWGKLKQSRNQCIKLEQQPSLVNQSSGAQQLQR